MYIWSYTAYLLLQKSSNLREQQQRLTGTQLHPIQQKSNNLNKMANKPKFYNAWFCPFAQRAWIALLHKGVDFEYIEQNPYNKTAEWLAVNPRGLVPTIAHEGKEVYESSICIEYIDEAWPNGPALMPKDPHDRAYVRIWSDHIDKKIVRSFYTYLLKQNQDEKAEGKAQFVVGIEQWLEAMRPGGPFFMGKDITMADIMLAPFVDRFDVLKHFYDFEVAADDKLASILTWWAAMKEVESIKKTLQPRDRLMEKYKDYAAGTAASEMADAIRDGKRSLP